ncbi:MAG: hypothetical protein LUP94_01625 [Candidatus Methanomethylicus sp.]|nr:hypothetical protein [Candidatus Methanomethylicus sp.]
MKRTSGYRALDMALEYAHLVPDQKRQAALRLEKAFGEGSRGANNSQ